MLLLLLIAILIAPQLEGLGQVFIFIQEYTGVVSPGILAVFLMGLFYKKATNNAAIWGAMLSIPIAMYFKVAPKGWSDASIFIDLPFMHQMGYTCIATIAVIAIIIWKVIMMIQKVSTFNIAAFGVLLITAFLYAMFWYLLMSRILFYTRLLFHVIKRKLLN